MNTSSNEALQATNWGIHLWALEEVVIPHRERSASDTVLSMNILWLYYMYIVPCYMTMHIQSIKRWTYCIYYTHVYGRSCTCFCTCLHIFSILCRNSVCQPSITIGYQWFTIGYHPLPCVLPYVTRFLNVSRTTLENSGCLRIHLQRLQNRVQSAPGNYTDKRMRCSGSLGLDFAGKFPKNSLMKVWNVSCY